MSNTTATSDQGATARLTASVKLFRGSELIATLGPFADTDGIAFSPSGHRLGVCVKREVIVFDLASASEIARVRSGCNSQHDLVFPDEAHVAAVGRDVNRGPAITAFRVDG